MPLLSIALNWHNIMRHLSTCVHNIGVQTRPWRDTRTTRDATEHKTYNLLATTTTPHLTAHTENSIQEHATKKTSGRALSNFPRLWTIYVQTSSAKAARLTMFSSDCWGKKTSAWPQTCGHVIRCLNICVGLVGIYYRIIYVASQDTIDNGDICSTCAFVNRETKYWNRLSFNCITWFAGYFLQNWIKFRV